VQKVEFKNSQGIRIAGILDLSERPGAAPAVTILHGFGGNKENSGIWAEMLNPLGIATLRIDFSGTGESEGKFEDKTITGLIDDTISSLNYIASLPNIVKDKLGVIGHSLGAAVAILSAAKDARIKTLVASAPGVKINKIIASLYDAGDFADAQKKGYVGALKNGGRMKLLYKFFEDAKQYDIIEEASRIPYRFLVIGAEKDSIVPFGQILDFCKQVSNAQLLSLPNSDHDLEEDWPIARKTIIEWFSQWLAV
jgi:alpha-beta hydrolase superfamily lysophospholipase